MFRPGVMAIAVLLLPTISQSQRSIGTVEPQSPEQRDTIDMPIEDWVGERFIFLEKSKTFQQFGGYRNMIDKKVTKYYDAYLQEVKYLKCVGKVAVVEEVIENFGQELVILKMEESGKYISAAAHKGRVEGIALLAELDRARLEWLNDTVYQKEKQIYTYDDALGEVGKFELKGTEPLTVLDVWWGFADAFGPLWLILEAADGRKGFLPIRFSWTNQVSDHWTEDRPWKRMLFGFNPNEEFDWSEGDWNLIQKSKIRIGMSQEQVRLAWRAKPSSINKTVSEGVVREQWVYESDQYVYFENGAVTALQE